MAMQHAPFRPARPIDSRPIIMPAQSSNITNGISAPHAAILAMNNAEAGPSNFQSVSTSKRKASGPAPAAKKRRSNGADESEDSGTTQQTTKTRESPKKKKAARACFHCQKAHLTCDDTRPCQRCVKRGMADKCTEGHRKKAKYLLDDVELEALKKAKNGTQSTPEAVQPTPPPPVLSQAPDAFVTTSNDLYSNFFDPSGGFSSEAATMEFSSLSAILGIDPFSPGQPFLSSETPPSAPVTGFNQPFANAAWPAEPQQGQPNANVQALMDGQMTGYDVSYANGMQQQNGQGQYVQPLYVENGMNMQSPQDQMTMAGLSKNPYPSPEMPYPTMQSQQARMQTPQSFIQPSPASTTSIQPAPSIPREVTPAVNRASNITVPSLVSPPSTNSPVSTSSVNEGLASSATSWSNTQNKAAPVKPQQQQVTTGTQNVYKTVTKAYDYTESYHFLMKFLPTRFQKNDILRVIRALAIYRPSIIALQAPMSDEDFIFMEKCIRRSLIELEKLISFSGTPTVVWRRTGEICLVGVEFCLLTDWKKEDLLTGRKYIYELFENQSVIEYWEKFASHAFENTTQSVFSHCVLLKPSGEPIPCTFCFSIRRDIFDLPSVVIGQWLPLL